MGRNSRKPERCRTSLIKGQRTMTPGHRSTVLLAIMAVLVIMVAVFCTLSSWSEQNEPTLEPVPASLTRVFNALVMKGNLSAVMNLLDSYQHLDWHSLNSEWSPIHLALQGRFESLSAQAHSLVGQHEVSNTTSDRASLSLVHLGFLSQPGNNKVLY